MGEYHTLEWRAENLGTDHKWYVVGVERLEGYNSFENFLDRRREENDTTKELIERYNLPLEHGEYLAIDDEEILTMITLQLPNHIRLYAVDR